VAFAVDIKLPPADINISEDFNNLFCLLLLLCFEEREEEEDKEEREFVKSVEFFVLDILFLVFTIIQAKLTVLFVNTDKIMT
jgi:hypothetical protein